MVMTLTILLMCGIIVLGRVSLLTGNETVF